MLTFFLTRGTMGNMKWLDNDLCLSILVLNGAMQRNVTPTLRDVATIPQYHTLLNSLSWDITLFDFEMSVTL
jgi:hypothetical protein